jgi:soluble lytic murein transglycosylase-like protein
MLAASPMRASDQNTAGKVSVVRVDRRTGKLVRTVSAASAPAAVKVPSKRVEAPGPIGELVEESARTHHVDPLLVHSVIQVESNYNPYAISVKGAEGLMQLMPATSRMLGVSNSFDPGQNIEAGVKYLKYLQDLYKDDRLALAAYNAVPGDAELRESGGPALSGRAQGGRGKGEVRAGCCAGGESSGRTGRGEASDAPAVCRREWQVAPQYRA